MQINIRYDASVAKAPDEAAFKACVQGVVNFYDSQFNDPITITIDVGWGEVDGFKIPNGGGAESVSNYTAQAYTYVDVRAAMAADATTADDATALANLSKTVDPTGGGMFSMTTAEAKALGLSTSNTLTDGWVGLDATTDWVFNTTNTNGSDVPPDGADAFSFLAHEFSEVMGRQMDFGMGSGDGIGGDGYYPEDLFDYTAKGVRSFAASASGRYFSLDGGATNFHFFNTDPSAGDPWDWLPAATPDSYDYDGSIGAVSANDLRVMDVLGYNPTPDFTVASLVISGAATKFSVSDISQGAAAASTTGLYLSTSKTVTTSDTLITTAATAAMAAGASVNGAATLILPGSTTPGAYFVAAIADSDGGVTESDSTNDVSNVLAITVVGGSSVSAINGKAGVVAFDPGSLDLTTALTLDGSLAITGSLTASAAIGGSGTLAFADGATTLKAGTTLTVDDVTQSGTAAVTLAETSLTFARVWTQSSGTLTVDSGDRLVFTGTGDVFDGTLAGAGEIAFTRGSDTFAGATLAATTVVIDAPSATLSGATAIDHVLDVTTAGLTVAASGATLTGGGIVTLSAHATNKISGASSAATLTNAADLIRGSGSLGGGEMRLVNDSGATIDGNGAIALTIDTGANAITNGGVIESAGKGGVDMASAVANTGQLDALGGNLTVAGAVTGTGSAHIRDGTADFEAAFSENVVFGASGILELAESQSYTGKISGFSKSGSDKLDLADIAYSTKDTVSFSGSTTSGVLTVKNGTHVASITLLGNYTTSTFDLSSDGHGGTYVVDPPSEPSASRFVTAMAAVAPAAHINQPVATAPRAYTPPLLATPSSALAA